MVPITALWLPIVLAAVLVFVVSSIVHMALGYHKSDYRALPREAEVLDALRGAGVTPGATYHFPYVGSMKEMGSPEAAERFRKGPVGLLTVLPSGSPAMAKGLVLWFVYTLLVSFFVAYLSGRTLGAGTHYLAVFRVAGAVAFMAYGLSQFADSVWKGQAWSVTVKHIADGLLYALVTGGTFGWLWPH
jgi:hypothetical protein